MKIRVLFIAFLVILGYTTYAQNLSPYSINWKTETILFGASTMMFGADMILSSHFQPLTDEDILLLDANNINNFDRSATENWDLNAKTRSDILLYSIPTIAGASTLLIPYLNKNGNPYFEKFWPLAVIGIETNLTAYLGTEIIKKSVQRTRPFVYNPNVGLDIKLEEDSRKSFISGHTSMTAANSFLLAKIFSDIYPESKYKPLVWGLAIALPAWTGTERYLAGKHFPSDVIGGYIFGAAIGYFVPEMHKSKELKNISVNYAPIFNTDYQSLVLTIKF